MINGHIPYMIPAVYVVLRKSGAVCLIRRANTGYCDGQLTLPSGHIEPNESIFRSAIREVEEEIGVNISEQNLKLVHVMKRRVNEGVYYVDFYFEADEWDGEPSNRELDKSSELIWDTPINVKNDLIDHVYVSLNSIQNKIMVSEF